jgi:hypothetical protein
MGSKWRAAADAVAHGLMKHRFVQQFVALFYKNGEWQSVPCCAVLGVLGRGSGLASTPRPDGGGGEEVNAVKQQALLTP